MVHLFYSKIQRESLLGSFSLHLEKLPPGFRGSILACKDKKSQILRLLGRLLLNDALKLYGIHDGLGRVELAPSGRPVLLDDRTEFNISHSGEYAVCAISKSAEVGVDIEKIRQIDISGFDKYFTREQMAAITLSKNPQESFFKNWTGLESLLKASGHGFSRGVPEIKKRGNSFLLDGRVWYTREVKIASGYFCSLTTDSPETEVLRNSVSY